VAAELDEYVEQLLNRPLDAAEPFTFAAADAVTMKVREGGRVVNGDGHRQVPGLRVATSETGSAWRDLVSDLVARGLAGVCLVVAVLAEQTDESAEGGRHGAHSTSSPVAVSRPSHDRTRDRSRRDASPQRLTQPRITLRYTTSRDLTWTCPAVARHVPTHRVVQHP
jgi:hypothetical protein